MKYMSQDDIEKIELQAEILDEFTPVTDITKQEIRNYIEKSNRHDRISELEESKEVSGSYNESAKAIRTQLAIELSTKPEFVDGVLEAQIEDLRKVAERDSKNDIEDVLQRLRITTKNAVDRKAIPSDVRDRVKRLSNN